MTYASALTALSDATRRTVLERLRGGPRSVSALAEGLPVSRPAVSQHLKVLEQAGLVTARRQGRHRIYEARPEGLLGLRSWIDSFWDQALDAYAATFDPTGEES